MPAARRVGLCDAIRSTQNASTCVCSQGGCLRRRVGCRRSRLCGDERQLQQAFPAPLTGAGIVTTLGTVDAADGPEDATSPGVPTPRGFFD